MKTSPERQALADALERISELNISIAVGEKDLAEAWETLHQASAAADKARALLDETPALQRRAKRREIEELDERVEDLREHRKEIEAKIAAAKDSLNNAQTLLRNRIADVVRAHPVTWKLVEKWQALQAQLAPLRETLRWLGRHRFLPVSAQGWESLQPPAEPDQKLIAAVDRLSKDASAPLPGE